jgi:DHA2 family multidrug resistance protein
MASVAAQGPVPAAAPVDGPDYAARRPFALIGIFAITTIQFLDGTIANVALPHMQSSLGASLENISWVLTSYMLAAAIAIPITGWLARRIGSRRLFLLSATGFLVTSAACGAAANLEAMVLFRVLQGLSAAFITPLSQSILLDITPPQDHTKALNHWGMIVMISPILGPLLGGYITDNYDWRWIFYINLPIGIPAIGLLLYALPESQRKKERLDLFGFSLIAMALCAFQLMLDRGQSQDWFESTEIVIEAAVAACAFWMFLVHSATSPRPLFERSLFANRVFAVGLLVMMMMGFLTYGLAALLPSLLQQVYGYGVFDAGMMSSPRGMGVLLGLFISGRAVGLVEGRWQVVGGYSLAALSIHAMTGWSPAMGREPILMWSFIQGVGMGITFTPMNALVFQTLSPMLRTSAASLLNLVRNMGASIGLSLFASNLAWSVQVNHQELSERLSANLPAVADPHRIEAMGAAARAALTVADHEINRQAIMIGYLNNLQMLFWVIVLALPMMLLLRAPRKAPAAI